MKDITFEDIQKANETIRTMTIERKDKNGKVTAKEYAEVNQRIKAFRMVYPTGCISTELLKNENGICIVKAIVGYTEEDKEVVLGTGTAYEKEGSSFINNTSYIENCETSAVGRALGMAGFGIDTSVASYEEVANATQQQDAQDNSKPISEKLKQGIEMAIDHNNIADDKVYEILQKYGYQSTAEIKNQDYMPIVHEFQKIAGK